MARKLFENDQEKEALYAQLKLMGAVMVEIHFQGGGDSGEIDSISYRNNNKEWNQVPHDMVSWTKIVYGTQEAKQEQLSLHDALEDLGYRALDNTDLDWYNNDGGQGALTIDLTENPPEIHMVVGINYTSTEDYEFTEEDLQFTPNEVNEVDEVNHAP